MAQVFPTKTNLISTRRSLALARVGYDLMDRKRNILVREMMQMIDAAKKVQADIGVVYEKAYAALKKANLTLGDCARFARAVPVDDDLTIDYRSVMGVEIPTVRISPAECDVRNFGFEGTNSDFDEACRLFRQVKVLTAQLAEIENSVCCLADAVEKTQKRSNALNNIMIPRLEETVKFITQALDEKEREEFSRLKVIKEQ